MVNYKVRAFCEPEDDDSIGAEVRIYNGEDEQIDTILITTESKYKELESRLDNMDENYLDFEELKSILTDAQENEIMIDAATLNGLNVNQFARAEHNELHTPYFAPIDHSLETSRYGLGNTTKYGHVRLVNNLDSTAFINGEALSANQGNVLKELVNTVKKELTSWTSVSCGKHGVLEVNSSLRLCQLIYKRKDYKSSTTGRVYSENPIVPSVYRPLITLSTPVAYTNKISSFIVSSNGKLGFDIEKANTKIDIYAQLMWKY